VQVAKIRSNLSLRNYYVQRRVEMKIKHWARRKRREERMNPAG
jgi:hypothetical protein